MVGSGLYSCVLGVAHPGRRGAGGRDADVALRRQPLSDAVRATSCSAPRCRSSTPAIARSRASCSKRCRSRRTRTTSSSTTKCWRRPRGSGFRSAKCRVPTSYAPDASSINFCRSVRYGFGCLATAAQFRLAKWGRVRSTAFPDRPPSRLQHHAPARELSEEQQQERHARQADRDERGPRRGAASPERMKTGNSTAVNRPTPSKPFGSDIAIELSAHAA